jgi:nitric oxide reductase NorQ protein
MRPNGELYWVRKMGPHDDVEVLREARRHKMPVLLFSGPGTGKTAMFEAAFAEDGFYYVPGTGDTEVSDFVGTYVPLPGGGFQWIDGPLPLAMEEGKPLLVDEVALIDARVMAVVYSVMDGRGELKITANPERSTVVAEDGFIVFGACNPRAPGARMSEALLSRFLLHVEVGIDYALMRRMGVPSTFVTVAQNIKKKYDSNEVGWFPAVREMLGFMKLSTTFGEDIALSNVIAQAPEMDRPQITDIITRGYGRSVKGLEIK